MVLTSRLHGCIIALALGKKLLAISGDWKVESFMARAGLEQLAKQKVMQVQSATEPPKKLSLGERAIMADGNDYVLMQMRSQGNPVEIIYATDGSPLVIH